MSEMVDNNAGGDNPPDPNDPKYLDAPNRFCKDVRAYVGAKRMFSLPAAPDTASLLAAGGYELEPTEFTPAGSVVICQHGFELKDAAGNVVGRAPALGELPDLPDPPKFDQGTTGDSWGASAQHAAAVAHAGDQVVGRPNKNGDVFPATGQHHFLLPPETRDFLTAHANHDNTWSAKAKRIYEKGYRVPQPILPVKTPADFETLVKKIEVYFAPVVVDAATREVAAHVGTLLTEAVCREVATKVLAVAAAAANPVETGTDWWGHSVVPLPAAGLDVDRKEEQTKTREEDLTEQEFYAQMLGEMHVPVVGTPKGAENTLEKAWAESAKESLTRNGWPVTVPADDVTEFRKCNDPERAAAFAQMLDGLGVPPSQAAVDAVTGFTREMLKRGGEATQALDKLREEDHPQPHIAGPG